MNHRKFHLVVILSFITLSPSRCASQDTTDTNRTRETVAQKIKGAWHKGAGPAVQRSHHAPAKINETETRVNEAKAAERFMQLRAQVNADLIRLEDGQNTEPIQSNVRTSTSGLHISGNSTVDSSDTIKESRAQLIGNAPPAPSKSAAGSNNK